MSAMVFLVEPGELDDVVVGSTISVAGEEGHHGAVVKRVRVDEDVDLVDGAGRRAQGTVRTVARGAFVVQVNDLRDESAPTPHLTVVQALAKGDRSLAAVEMLTEVGVDAVVPWQAARSIARWDDSKRAKGQARWLATARAATKQSRRSRVPTIGRVRDTAAVAALVQECELAILLDEEGAARLAHLAVPRTGSVCVIVGPEGGIHPTERAELVNAGALVARMGDSVLRTSTAGVAAACVIMARSGRWD
jgi:16S rRNA (uracil1498-N3)-methyltransferase